MSLERECIVSNPCLPLAWMTAWYRSQVCAHIVDRSKMALKEGKRVFLGVPVWDNVWKCFSISIISGILERERQMHFFLFVVALLIFASGGRGWRKRNWNAGNVREKQDQTSVNRKSDTPIGEQWKQSVCVNFAMSNVLYVSFEFNIYCRIWNEWVRE